MINDSQFSTFSHILLITSLLLLIATQIGVSQSLKGRIVAQVSQDDMKVLEVGDVPGHTVMLLKAKGLAFLENNEVAEVIATEVIDNTNGKGTYQGYEMLTFEDGSTVVSQFEGQDFLSEDGKYVLFEGTFITSVEPVVLQILRVGVHTRDETTYRPEQASMLTLRVRTHCPHTKKYLTHHDAILSGQIL